MKLKLLYLGNQLAKHGYNKTTIETLGPALESEGVVVYYSSDKKIFLFRLLAMMKAVVRHSKKVDYILIDTYSTRAFWYALICSFVARVFKTKYIPILHGGNLPSRLKTHPVLCRLFFQYAYKNVAPSEYLQHEFEQAGFKNVLHIPNSIELQKYVFKERQRLTPKLLWVRSFAKIYNPKMAVNVLFELQKIYPNASLTMIGPDKDGSLVSTKKLAESLNLEVNFTGKLSKKEWVDLAKDYDIFINTTHFDNTPISIIEAMALGLPVVSTNVGGIPYLLSNRVNALLVADDDVNEMVICIHQFIENPIETNKLINNAKDLLQKRDWNQIKKQWLKLLQ